MARLAWLMSGAIVCAALAAWAALAAEPAGPLAAAAPAISAAPAIAADAPPIAPAPQAAAPGQLRLVGVEKIWDRAPHNAFTDLVRFKDRWFCTFREGKAHVSPDGALRVIASADGRTWTPAAILASPTADLRDPKLSVTPDGRLMLLGAAAPHNRTPIRQSLAWFSSDGAAWTEPAEVGDPDFWLWRVAWRGGTAYGVGYDVAGRDTVRLYRSADGRKFETLAADMGLRGYPGETALLFDADGTGWALVRREAGDKAAQLGRARPPYAEWTWKGLGEHIGGPALTRAPDGRLLAAVRLYTPKTRTALCWIDPDAGRLTEALSLPSGGDTSYAGILWHDGLLWMSYYASHEGKACIYLARVALPPPAGRR